MTSSVFDVPAWLAPAGVLALTSSVRRRMVMAQLYHDACRPPPELAKGANFAAVRRSDPIKRSNFLIPRQHDCRPAAHWGADLASGYLNGQNNGMCTQPGKTAIT